MDTNELITLVGVFVGGILMGAVGYLRKVPPPPNPVMTGIVGEYGNKEMTERGLALLGRLVAAAEVIADKRTTEFEELQRNLMEKLDRREEQEESHRRPEPPRPRRR